MKSPGAGLLFNPALSDYVARPDSGIDHLAVIPDRCWIDHGVGAGHRFELLRGPMEVIEHAARRWPTAMHAIGLSICSADLFDLEYVEQLARWRERLGSAWVSEHLSFSRLAGEHESNAALALASPWDHELLELLVPRIRKVQEVLGVPFLLENGVAYVDYDDGEMSEPEFLNALVAETGCGLLLDLHNLYTNARNHRRDALDFIAALDMGSVQEIHVAGGDAMLGFHTDSHAGPVLPEVWPLLEAALRVAPRLQAVTFEFHEGSWGLLRTDGVRAQVERIRRLVEASHVAQ